MRRTRANAFTLVELLVVIAIIIALLAILLPSMGRAIATASRTVCLTNLRQVGVGFSGYHADNQGILFRPPTSNPHDSYHFWGGVTMDWDYAYLPSTYNKTTHPYERGINPYLPQDNPVYVCPDDPEGDTRLWAPFGVDPEHTSTKAYYSTAGSSYIFNAYTVKNGIHSLSMIQSTGMTYLAVEWPAFDVMTPFTRPATWTALERWSFHDNDGAGSRSFQETFNGNSTVFFDGHAEYVMYEMGKWNTSAYHSGNP